MTYCVAARLNAGLVFLSDSRTNAGWTRSASPQDDRLRTPRRTRDGPDDRRQPGRQPGRAGRPGPPAAGRRRNAGTRPTCSRPRAASATPCARSTAARSTLREQGVDFNVSLIFGARSAPSAAGCSRSTPPATSSRPARNARTSRSARRYGKPILDRVLQPDTPLDEAAKCALISMDSTLRSNISVGLPLTCWSTTPARCASRTSPASTSTTNTSA